jgi:hypothetical protein
MLEAAMLWIVERFCGSELEEGIGGARSRWR